MAVSGYLSVREAAEALGWSQSKVRQWFHSERLAGMRGPQPQRPRILIRCDGSGRPLDSNGQPVAGQSLRARFNALDGRVSTLESRVSSSTEVERFRDAALLQQDIIQRQQRAYDLQAEATQELSEALQEQARIVTTLLVGDLSVLATSDNSQITEDA